MILKGSHGCKPLWQRETGSLSRCLGGLRSANPGAGGRAMTMGMDSAEVQRGRNGFNFATHGKCLCQSLRTQESEHRVRMIIPSFADGEQGARASLRPQSYVALS